jgi:formamidopyrimidine-DNA glycosylase
LQLPEVEVARKDLEKEVVGKRVKDVTVRSTTVVAHHRNRPEFTKALVGRKIESVTRRGVHLLFSLDGDTTLVVRMGSQASLSRHTASEPPGRHTQVVATFTTGGALHYTDPAVDGELYVVENAALADLPELRPAGIDPLADTFTWLSFGEELKRRHQRLKPLLADSSLIVGLGDIYADEILWAAGLSGARSSESLSSQEVRRLYRAVLEVLFEAVKQGGNEPSGDEEDPFGEGGGQGIKVYGRDGQPCLRCRQPIQHSTIAKGITAYHCAQCQT